MATETVLATAVSNGRSKGCCKSGPGYATPLAAMAGPREKLIYLTALYSGTHFILTSSTFLFIQHFLAIFGMNFFLFLFLTNQEIISVYYMNLMNVGKF